MSPDPCQPKAAPLPPSKAAFLLLADRNPHSRTRRQALEIIKPKLPQVEINASSLCEAVAPVSILLNP